MRRIYVSTVGRGKKLKESSKVYCIDYDTGKIIASTRIPEPNMDLSNPRGGCRGCRGLTILNDSLWAAGWDCLFELDLTTLELKRGFWSKDCQDIHQIYTHNNEILLVSSWNNKTFSFNPSEGNFTEQNDFTDIFVGEQVDLTSPDSLHYNSMADKYILLNRPGIIANKETKEVVYKYTSTGRGHDLCILPSGEIATNCAGEAGTIAIDLNTGDNRDLLRITRKPELDGPLAQHGWTRGMSYIENHDLMFVGSAPASVFCIGGVMSTPSVLKEIHISDEVVETVFDVIPHPEDWL